MEMLLKLAVFSYSLQMRENTDKNNSEYGHFLRSVRYSNFHKKLHLDAWLGSDSTSDSDIKHICV